MAIRNLIVRGGADFSGMRREMSNAQRTITNFQTNVSRAMKGVGVALAALGVTKLVKDSTELAMGVESSVNQINRIMGLHSKEFLKWANDQSSAYGMAKADAIKYGAVYSNLVSGFSKDTAQTTQRTEDLLKASAVVASGTGRTMEDTMERIRSGLLGNTEAIEDLGINVNVALLESTKAFQQFANGKSWQQLDFQTQQQIRLMAILEQANTKYGDSLANTTATQMQMFRSELKNVQLSLGQAFLPILSIVLPILTELVRGLAYVMNIFAQFMQALFGKTKDAQTQAKATNQQAAAVTGLGKATEGAGKKAKKAGKDAQGALASFDEINSLSQSNSAEDSADGTDGASNVGGGIGTVEMPKMDTNILEVSTQIQQMAENVKSSIDAIINNIVSYGGLIAQAFSGLGPALQPILDAKEPILAAFNDIGSTATTFMETVLKPLGDYILLDFVPNIVTAFATSFAPVFADVAIFEINEFAKTFKNVTNLNAELLNSIWIPNLDKLKNCFITNMPIIATSLQSLLDNTIKPLVDYILNGFILPIVAKINEVFVPIFTDITVSAFKQFSDSFSWAVTMINDVYNTVLKPVFDLIKAIVLDTLEIVKGLWDKYGSDLLSNISEFITGVQDTFQKLWDNVLKPIIEPFLVQLSWLWDKHIKGLVETIGGFIAKCVNGALEIYNKFIKPMIDWIIVEFGPPIANTINFIGGVFGTIFAGIADVIGGIIETLGGLIDFIVGVFTGNWKKAWDGVKSVFKGVFDSLVGIVKVPINLIIDAINYMIGGLNNVSFDMPDWAPGDLGGKTFGISIPKIPKLARGGIVDSPTIAQIGEAGKEMVVPLENTSFVDKLASSLGSAVMAAMQMSSTDNNNGQGDIVMQLDGTVFARLIKNHLNQEDNRVGNRMIIQAI